MLGARRGGRAAFKQRTAPDTAGTTDLSANMGDRAWATELVTAPESAHAAHEHEAAVHGDLRFVAV